MKITTSYHARMKIKEIKALKDTVSIYTNSVRFLIDVCLNEWDIVEKLNVKATTNYIEKVIHATALHPNPKYSEFDKKFPKFPCYFRRAAIVAAKKYCSAYKTNLAKWEKQDSSSRGKAPSLPKLKAEMPVFYKDNTYEMTETYSIKIKLYLKNDWRYVNADLRKSDIDYILHHCSNRTALSPALRHNYKVWEICFPFEENVELNNTPIKHQRILAVDLGINNSCACSVMTADSTVHGRHFYKASVEEDSLKHKLNKIKKAQQHGSIKTSKLWAKANGYNTKIARDTARFIIDTAVLYNVDTIVFEHLDTNGKKKGSKKQRLHLWKKKAVQNQVTLQAHRLGIRISHVCAWNTSAFAFDGSGFVERGSYIQNGKEQTNYSICVFSTGKQYNCDLNASYNIGARYFIREILKSLPEMTRLSAVAKVPQLDKRSICTLSSLISLNVALAS